MASATSHRCPMVLDLDGLDGGATGDESLLRHILTSLTKPVTVPDLLNAVVHTGAFCVYQPDSSRPLRWRR